MQKASCYGGYETVRDKSAPSNVDELVKAKCHITEESTLNSLHGSFILLCSSQYLACSYFFITHCYEGNWSCNNISMYNQTLSDI